MWLKCRDWQYDSNPERWYTHPPPLPLAPFFDTGIACFVRGDGIGGRQGRGCECEGEEGFEMGGVFLLSLVQKPSPSGAVGGLSRDENEFRLEVDFIKLLPVRDYFFYFFIFL